MENPVSPYIENARVMIAEYDHLLEKIEQRLDAIDDSEPVAAMIRTQLELSALMIRGQKMERESMLGAMENPSPPAYMPIPAQRPLPCNFDVHQVKKTCAFISTSNPSIANVVFEMNDGTYVDPVSGEAWTLTDEWDLARTGKGLDWSLLTPCGIVAPVPGVKS